jgi:glycine/D-amino acid oxidase-like deaminating enzyme
VWLALAVWSMEVSYGQGSAAMYHTARAGHTVVKRRQHLATAAAAGAAGGTLCSHSDLIAEYAQGDQQ